MCTDKFNVTFSMDDGLYSCVYIHITIDSCFFCADKGGKKFSQTNYRTECIYVNIFLYELCNWIYYAFIKPTR